MLLDLTYCFNFPGKNLKQGYEKTSICVQDGSPQESIHFDFLHSEACNPSPHFLCTAEVLFWTVNYSLQLFSNSNLCEVLHSCFSFRISVLRRGLIPITYREWSHRQGNVKSFGFEPLRTWLFSLTLHAVTFSLLKEQPLLNVVV